MVKPFFIDNDSITFKNSDFKENFLLVGKNII